jgi:hypothetical protein
MDVESDRRPSDCRGHLKTAMTNAPEASMNAIKVETTVDEATARAIPALRPLLGKRVELIALQSEVDPTPRRKHTLDDLLAGRLSPPPGIGPVSIEDMEKAIETGATSAGN